MKKLLSFLYRALPHTVLILSLMLLTFFVIDLFNESMGFLNNTVTKYLVGITSLLTAILSIITVIRHETKYPPK